MNQYRWEQKSENAKSKILHVLCDLSAAAIANRVKFGDPFLQELETACLFLVDCAEFKILSTVAQLYLQTVRAYYQH